jgi:hypothetical protein
MIRGVVKDGAIVAIEPIPDDWSEGRQVRVEAAEAELTPEEIDRWYGDLARTDNWLDQDDYEKMTKALAEAHQEAKASMRRKMGLE